MIAGSAGRAVLFRGADQAMEFFNIMTLGNTEFFGTMIESHNIAAGSGTADANVTNGSDLRIGDTVMLVDAGSATANTPAISAISGTDVTFGSALSGTPANGATTVADNLSVQTRAGLTSIDDIVAINNDSDAPMFNFSRYGAIGDYEELLPALTKQIAKLKE